MAKGSVLRKVWHFLVNCQSPRKDAQHPTVKASQKTPQVAGTQLCPSCSRFAHDRGELFGELGAVYILLYGEMKRTDCHVCSILCEGLEQYVENPESLIGGIPLQVQEGIVQLHTGGERSDYLEFFTNAGMKFILI